MADFIPESEEEEGCNCLDSENPLCESCEEYYGDWYEEYYGDWYEDYDDWYSDFEGHDGWSWQE